MVCVTDIDEIGSDESTGRAISAIFDAADSDGRMLDREKVALAWAAAWRLAVKGDAAEAVDLPSEARTSDDVLSGFAGTLGAGRRRGRIFESLGKTRAGKARGSPVSDSGSNVIDDAPIQTRELKSPSDLDVARWEIIQPAIRPRKGAPSNRPVTLRAVPARESGSQPEPTSRAAPRGYTDQELETVAVDVLRRVLETAGRTGDDFRAIRRLGADVIDDIGRFFEIKSSYGSGGDSVTLTAHEAKRAQLAKSGEFFLAVITGLEKGYQTQVRIIPDPLDNLEWGEDGSLTVTGVRQAGIVIDVDIQ